MKAILISLVLVLPLAAGATEPPKPALEEMTVTASRAQQTIGDTPANISLVSGELLKEISHTHINEAMTRVSGTWISRGNGQESLTAIRSPVLTGAGGCGAFLMAQDSIPLRASGFCNVNELFEAHTEIAQRIEVLKGPGTAAHGSNAMHGQINVITPAPGSRERELQLEAGPYGYGRVKFREGHRNWRADISATTDDGYKDNSGFDQQKITLKTTGDVGAFTNTSAFAFTNLNQETAGFIQGDDAYKDDSLKRTNPNPEAFRDARSARFYSRFERTLGEDGYLQLTPYARYTDMTFLQHFLPGQPVEENGHASIGLQSQWQPNSNWTLGADLEYTDGFLRETQFGPTEGPPFLVDTIPPGKHYDYDVTAIVAAVFAEYRWKLAEATTITLAGRAEQVRYDYTNNMLTGRTRDDGTPCPRGGCRFSRPADRTDNFTNVSPKIALLHDFTPASQLYVLVGRGFRAPQATELYRLQSDQLVSDIRSEELDSVEAGLRGGNERLSWDVSVYAMDKDNVIFRDSNRNNVDNARTSHRGVEVSLSATFSDAWSGTVDYTYARHRYANNPEPARLIDGNDVDTAPRHLGSAALVWQPVAALRAELEWVHMGAYYTNPENTQQYDGHDLFNLRVSYRVNPDLTLFARVMNLTDTDYAERADFAFGNERYFVGEPIRMFAGVRWRPGK